MMTAMRVRHCLATWVVVCILLTNVLARKCTKKCPSRRSPVCGSDGTTYKNQCKLENRACYNYDLFLVSQGECNFQGCKQPCAGPRKPVCATDGVTFDSLCHLDNAACDDASISMRADGPCPKEAILTSFQSFLEATGVTRGPSEVIFEVEISSSTGSQPVSGRGLWKLGVYGCRYIDGWGEKINHIPQILSDEQASTSLGRESSMTIRDIRATFDISVIGCDNLPYICMELSKGDDPRPDYVLTIPGQFGTAIDCYRLDCVEVPVTEAPQWTPACRYECPQSGTTICGTDGVTYDTQCALDNEKRCGEHPESYLLERKNYGRCRTGVIIDSLFWSAQGSESGQGRTAVAVQTLIMSNSTGESISGRNLWRMGMYGSRFEDGSGPRLGYIPQLLDEAQASTTFAAGKAIVLNAEAEFDIAAVGCSRYKFMCLEFSKGDSPQPPFPFTGNSGTEESSVFTACQRVPCNGQPERDIPDDGRKRVYVGELGWGLKAGGRRPDGDYDVTLTLTARILELGDYVAGNNLLRVGLFGSTNIYGEGDRFAFRRQTLTRSQSTSALAPNSNLVIEDIETHFPVTELGCSEYGFLCVELAKSDTTDQDFLLIPESLDISSPNPDSVVICNEIPCSNPGGQHPGTNNKDTPGLKTVRVAYLNWRLSVDHINSPEPSDLVLEVNAKTHPRSDSISGEALWRVGLYASEDMDPMGPKERYNPQILSHEQQSMQMFPNTTLSLTDISTQFNVDGLGCGELDYICLEFTRGYSPEPDFLLPLPQLDDDGVTKRFASCKPWPCQDRTTHGDGGGHGGGNMGHEGETGGSNQGTGGHGNPSQEDPTLVAFSNIRWERHPASPESPSDITVRLTPHSLSNPLAGYNMWRVGLFGGDNSDGSGTRFEAIENVLSYSDRSKPLVLGEILDFAITTPREMRDLGCRHSYLCIEFTKNGNSVPPFQLKLGRNDYIVSCQSIACDENTRHPSPGLDSNLPTASFHNISWSATAGAIRAGHITDLNVYATVFPNPDTDSISGKRLWRIGLYGNMYKDGSGAERISYNEQILTPKQAKQPMYPNRPLVFDVDTRFPLNGFGCGIHRYLCIEFAQHNQPDPEFNFPVPNGAHVSCRPYFCQDEPNPEPEPDAGGQPVARVGNYVWRMERSGLNPNGLAKLRVLVDVTPSPDTDIISGQNLWRVGVYGSKNRNGGEPYEDRYDYNPQIIQAHDARHIFGPNRPLNLDLNTAFDLRELGCGPFKYFCVEFGKDHLAVPEYAMELSDGDVTVSCERFICQAGGIHTGDGGQPDSSTLRTAQISNINWRLLGPTVYPNGDSDLRMLMQMSPHPSSDRINGGQRSGLWRVGIFGNRNAKGTHPMKINYERQILSQEDRDQSLIPPNVMNFDISTPFDLRRAHCTSEYPFLCLEIAKGETATPDFNLPFNDGALAFVTCQPSPCLETDTRVHSNVPVATVTAVNIAGATVQPNTLNKLFLDVSVKMADDSSIIRGANLWRVEMWGSTTSRGQGPRISPVNQVLSEAQTDRHYVPPEPLHFAAVPFDLDMMGRDCSYVTHVCAAISKLATAVPDFTLEASPNNNVLTKCLPVDCSRPFNPQIAVSGLSLFQTVPTSLNAGRPNTLTIGVRVNYEPSESISFTGTDLWGLQMWMSAKANGKGKKLGMVNQALNAANAAEPLVVGQDLEFSRVQLGVNLMGKKCKEARYVCTKLFKNPQSSENYQFFIATNPKSMTQCLAVNCS